MGKGKRPYRWKDLFSRGSQRTYRGRNLDRIAFPLGGIGTGTISLGGWGQLRDWEIRNRPAKGFAAPDSFFTLRVEQAGKAAITKVVQGPAGGDFVGGGHSMPTDSGQGLPHFRKVSFRGEYPFARVRLRDPAVPVRVTLEAYNPLIPLNDKDSGIPVAILLYHLKNTSSRKVEATLFGNLSNIVGEDEGRRNEARCADGLTGLYLTNERCDPGAPQFGSMALTTPWPDTAVWPRWEAGHGRLAKFWEAVAWSSGFPPQPGEVATGTVAARATIGAGKKVTVPFYVTWHFPNFEHWRKAEGDEAGGGPAVWRNYYATIWSDAWDAADYVAREHDRLYRQTRRFHAALFGSTLPDYVLDAVSSQISVLRTTTCLRLEDGTFYGFEGCNDTSGCCEGSCTHVWNYAQALPYLFPALQRSMMEAHFRYSMNDDGYIQFRMPLPLGRKAEAGFVPAADGQMGLVMQVYREWLVSNDEAWLGRVWPQAQRALEFAWRYWDADRDGVMEGVQHNTYDMEWWGPNTMTGSLYLGALRAGEELARAVGDEASAAAYRELFERGSAWTDEHLFNGEYYEQQVNPRANDAWPQPYHSINDRGRDDKFPGWPRWQFGTGCLSDQLIGQWYAEMLALGSLYDRGHVRAALESIFRCNWRADLGEHACTLRVYAVGDEAGLIIATWPRGGRPGYAFWFADEVWCGIEYQVASHLIYEGLVEQGLSIVRGVRERHRGDRRNPWDEFECGHHYARSMASYALLTALSGFRYSAAERAIGFAPRVFETNFRTFFSVASGWGRYSQRIKTRKRDLSIGIEHGSLPLREVRTPLVAGKSAKVAAALDGREIAAEVRQADGGCAIRFQQEVVIEAGGALKMTVS